VSWVTSLLSGKQRALGLAAVNALTNIGGFVGPYVIGALSTATGNFNASIWFVAGAIFTAGVLVAAFPLRWAAHTDAPAAAARASSALELRRASELLRSLAASRGDSSVVASEGGGGGGGGTANGAGGGGGDATAAVWDPETAAAAPGGRQQGLPAIRERA
jgi:hypothetical protein